MKYAKRKGIAKARRPRKYVRRNAGKSNLTFAKKVRSVIQKSAETKSIQYFADQTPVGDYVTGALGLSTYTMPVIYLTPNSNTLPIILGTSVKDRIGNRVTLKRVMFRGLINPAIYNVSANPDPRPFIFKLWIGYQRNTAYSAVENTLPNFLQSGSTSTSPQGTTMDTFRKINTDKYVICYSRQFKVGTNQIVAGGTAYASLSANQNWNNNDFKFNQKFSIDVTRHCVKHLKFNDSDNQPQNRGLFAWYEAVACDGTTFSAGSRGCDFSYEIAVDFTDM